MFLDFFLELAGIIIALLPLDGLFFLMGTLSTYVFGDDFPGKIDIAMVIKTLIVAGILGDIYSAKYISFSSALRKIGCASSGISIRPRVQDW